MSQPVRRRNSFDFANQVFGDRVMRRGGEMSEPRREPRRCEFRAASANRRRADDMQLQRCEERYGQDVPYGRESRVPPPMGSRGADARPWGERLRRPGSPTFERGRRPFRVGHMARGRLFVPRDRTPPRTTAALTLGTTTTRASAGQHGRGPRPYVALNRIDDSVGPHAAPVCNVPPVEERDPRNYSQYRSCKRHSVLDHHMRYDHRHRRMIQFK